MKKLLIFLLILVLIAGGGLFAFYKTLDEESYKAQIIEATKELTGRDMLVKGDVSIHLFPSPTISMSNVEVKNKSGSQNPNMMTIEKVDASVKWGSLFENPLIIEKIVLKSPALFIERDAQGMPNWDFPFLQEKNKSGAQDSLIGRSILELPPQFKNLTIQDGSITYANAMTGLKLALPSLNGHLSSDSMTGPFRFNGTFDWNKTPIRVDLTTGKLSSVSASDIKLTLTDTTSRSVLGLTGKVQNLTRNADFAGGFTFNIPQLSKFLTTAMNYKDLPASLEKPVVGTSTFEFSRQQATFKDVALRYGTEELENSSTGTVTFTYPSNPLLKTKIAVSLLLNKLDVDAFKPLIPSYGEMQTRILSWGRTLPADLEVTLNAKDLSLNGGTLKESTVAFLLQNGEMQVKEFKSTLPDTTLVNASGLIGVQNDKPIAQMHISIQAADPKKTIDWLKLPTPSYLTLDYLESLKLETDLILRPTDITFNKIDATVNKGSVKGAVAFSLTEKKLTGVSDLVLKNINLDTYFPYEAPQQNRTFTELLQYAKTNMAGSFMDSMDFRLKLSGSDVTFKTIPVRSFDYDGFIKNGEWVTTKMNLNQAATADIQFTGRIQKLPDGTFYLQDLIYNLEIPKASVLLDRLKITPPIPGALNKTSIKGTASGSFDNLSIQTDMSFSQANIKLEGNIVNALSETPQYNLALNLAHPNFHQFMKLFNPNFNQFPYLTGTFNFKANLKGTANQFDLLKMESMFGNQRFKGDVSITKADKTTVKGNLSTSLLYMEKIFPKKSLFRADNPTTRKAQFSNDLLDFKAFDGLDLDLTVSTDKLLYGAVDLDLVSSHFTLKEKLLSVDSFKGTLNGGAFNMTAQLNTSTAEPTLRGTLQGDSVSLKPDLLRLGLFRLKSGSATFSSDFNARGNSIEDMVKSLSATGRFSIKSGIVSGLNLNAFERSVQVVVAKSLNTQGLQTRLSKEISTGETAFETMTGSYAVTNGVVRTSDAMFRANGANAIIQLTYDMPNWTILSSMGLNLQTFEGFPPISIVVKGLAHAPETEFDLSAFIKYISTAADEAQNAALQKQRQEEEQRAAMDAQQRLERVTELREKAISAVTNAEQILNLAPTPNAENEMIRAKDALAVLQELSLKENVSVADLQKIEEQSALAISRATEAQKEAAATAFASIRQQVANIAEQAQNRMHAINRINQRLAGVELIEQAYKKGFSTMTLIHQLKDFVDQSNDVSKMQQALAQAKDASEIMELTYESVAKFDMDAVQSATEESPATPAIKGTIKRRGSLN